MSVQNIQASQWKPEKRNERLIVQAIDAELLMYDEEIHKACCLNDLAAAVWTACDGSRTASVIALAVTAELGRPVSEDVVLFTLAELRRDELLVPDAVPQSVDLPSRRDVVRRLGLGAAMMLPVVTSIMAPKAAQAYSGCVDCQTTQPSQGQTAPQRSSGSSGAPTGFPQ